MITPSIGLLPNNSDHSVIYAQPDVIPVDAFEL